MNRIFLVCSFILFTGNIFAQAVRSDFNFWGGFEVKHQVSKKFEISVQFQSRFDKDANRLRGNYFNLDGSRKLGKGFRILFETRFATSANWDKYRFGLGLQKTIKLNAKGHSEIKIRTLYQYQFFPTADEIYGIDEAQQNYRFRISYNQKLVKKTYFTFQSEPMWRLEGGEFFFRRLRTTASIKRSLPGPWTIEAGYSRQLNFNRRAKIDIVSLGLSYEIKRKKKVKVKPVPSSK